MKFPYTYKAYSIRTVFLTVGIAIPIKELR